MAVTAMFSITVTAQNITDAARYSMGDLNGTARYRSMSGAFGALGGDLSALEVNPAGSAVFINGFASLSLSVENAKNEVNFKNGFNSDANTNVDLGQAGAVFVFQNNNEQANWSKFSLAFNYQKSASYEDDFAARGDNNTSIDQYFIQYANGVALDYLVPFEDETVADLYSYLGENVGFAAQQALLGLQGGVIDIDNPNNLPEDDPDYYELNSYKSSLSGGPYDQLYSYHATGLNGKFTFNFATQYQDFLYLGLNLNTHFINFEKTTIIDEGNVNMPKEYVYFEESLSSLGNGFSLQLGAIAKAGENLRLGLAYETPTWYSISEESLQYVETDIATINPQVVNIYPDYKLQTPANYTGSIAYLFGSQALLSFDYSYKDYSSTTFKPKGDPAFIAQNKLISNELQGASSFKLGGEYRIQDWSIRGGYRFEESPYKNESTIGELQGWSAGLGYNFGNIRIDLAYDGFSLDKNPQLYQVGLTDRVAINRDNNNFTLSVGFAL